MNIYRTVSLSLIILLLPLSAVAKDKELMQRVDVLERMMKGQGLISLMSRIDQLEGEIQRLNGENENLRYQLELMQRREKDLYADLDQRLTAAENANPVNVPPPISAPATTERQDIINAENNRTDLPTPTTPSSDSDVQGEAAYQAALQTLRQGEYETAAAALGAFPAQYPQSSYLPNAYYWQGEAEYVLNNFDKAVAAFQMVINDFPTSNKVADATLKLGFSQQAQGDTAAAKETLAKVIQQYPGTSAARLAQSKLDAIGQ
jgi:tol-pal system protein YbgF